MSLKECCIQEGLLCWRWNMKQTLPSEYMCKEQTPSYLCVCPCTSKVPVRSDAGRGLALTKFGGICYKKKQQWIMSNNILVLRPDSLPGHFSSCLEGWSRDWIVRASLEVHLTGLSENHEVHLAYSPSVSKNFLNTGVKPASHLPKDGWFLWLILWTSETIHSCFLSAWAATGHNYRWQRCGYRASAIPFTEDNCTYIPNCKMCRPYDPAIPC